MRTETDVEEIETPDAAPSDGGVTGSDNSMKPWVYAGYLLAGILAAVPVVRMIGIVLDGSRLQFDDYWDMVQRTVTMNGGIDIAGLFHFQNYHPVVIPQLLYWLNVRIFSGSNISLGLVVVGIVVGQLVVVALLLRDTSLRPIQRIVIFVLTSALLFDLTGTWTFSKSMSGAAWLTANLFVLVAVYLRGRDQRYAAIPLAVLASISYGTGIIVWPALIATGACRRPNREIWREWPYAVGFVATYLWYRASGPGQGLNLTDPLGVIKVDTRMLGFVLGLEGRTALVIGCIAFIGVPVLAIYFFAFSRPPGVAGWVGIATYGWLALLEVSSGRLPAIKAFGLQNRYTSLAAIVWIGFASLLLFAASDLGHRWSSRWKHVPSRSLMRIATAATALLVAVPLIISASTAGRDHADAMLNLKSRQDRNEIALRFGFNPDTSYLVSAFGKPSTLTPLLRNVGHFPFVDDWDVDCGLQGKPLTAGSVRGTTGGKLISSQLVATIPGSVEVTGFVTNDRPIRCIVVTDAAGVVIGASVIGSHLVDAPPGTTGFEAFARSGGGDLHIYVVTRDNPAPLLLGTIPQPAAA